MLLNMFNENLELQKNKLKVNMKKKYMHFLP